MTGIASQCARALWNLHLPKASVAGTRSLYCGSRELQRVLTSPAIQRSEKLAVISRVFPDDMQPFLQTLCDLDQISVLPDVLDAYDTLQAQAAGELQATLLYVQRPSEAQLAAMQEMLCQKHGAKSVRLNLQESPQLLGGYVLRVGDVQYDDSFKTKLAALQGSLSKV